MIILNSKQIKNIMGMLDQQFGFKTKLNYVFLTRDNELFIINRDFSKIDETKLRIKNIGLHFATINNGLILTIEGSQIVGPESSKSIIDLDNKQARAWFNGQDIDMDCKQGYVLLRHNNDFLGSTECKNNKIINSLPRSRRANVI